MTATALTSATVLVPAGDVHAVELDGETVLYVPRDHRLHLLNATASRVWECLRPTASVAQISSALASAFGADRAQVQADVSALLSQLLSAGAVTRSPTSEEPTTGPAE